jgi:hypothetical protein
VFERHVISTVDVEDDDEFIEVLDPGFEVATVHQVDRHHGPVSPRVIEKDVLDARRCAR